MTKQQNFTIILLVLFISNFAKAQEKSQEAYDLFESIPAEVEDQVFRVDFIAIGFQYEKGLTEDATLQAAIYPFRSIVISNSSNDIDVDFVLAPQIEVSYRYYYNLHKRKGKFKNFTNNSGQYVAPKLSFSYLISPTERINSYSDLHIGGVWGFQKNGDPITFNFEIGFGYGVQNIDFATSVANDISGGNFASLGKLSVGFLVGKRNRAYKKYKRLQ